MNWLTTNTSIYVILFIKTTPQVGLEPTTNRLTADCSTTELSRIVIFYICYENYFKMSIFYFTLVKKNRNNDSSKRNFRVKISKA